MKVFIGWSGETSGKIAPILQKWLTQMFDGHINVVSSHSIEIGSKWNESLNEMISSADCGLLCVTEDNANSQWLAYEAGALSRNAQFVAPLLFHVNLASLGAPLLRFEPFWFDFDNMRELLRKLNDLLGEDALPAEELEESFQARFPALEMLVTDTLEESAPQMREDWERNELNEISVQLAELTKRVEKLKRKLSSANQIIKFPPLPTR